MGDKRKEEGRGCCRGMRKGEGRSALLLQEVTGDCYQSILCSSHNYLVI